MTEVFAHRGLHATARENTVAAFLAARAAECDGVELDVRRTRDGALVIHHDAAVEGIGAIPDLDCRALPPWVPTVAEAMTACGDLTVNVEIKNSAGDPGHDPSGALAHQVVSALAELDRLGGVVISSFDRATCEAVRSADSAVAVGWLLDWRKEIAPAVEVAAELRFTALHPFFRGVDRSFVERAHAAGLAVNVWTVNGADEMRRLCDLGVDVIITDEVALALAVVRSRA